MIYVGILNTDGIDPSDSSIISKIPEEARGRVEKTLNEKEKINRIGAYILLIRLCEELFNEKNIQIRYTDKGKPCLYKYDYVNKNSQILTNISISHDGAISCVALCDDNFDVGIDVQEEKTDINCSSLSKRFFKKIKGLSEDMAPLVKSLVSEPVLLNKGVSLKCFNYGDGCVFEVPCIDFLSERGINSQNNKDFFRKWTYLESHLKMSGDGFSGISCFDEIALGAECGCVEFFKNGNLYFLNVSVKEKKLLN